MAVKTSSPKAASPSPENRSAALAFSAASSASLSRGFPANAVGRSNGVALLFAHTPCRSGWPSAVLGGVHLLEAALAAFACAWAAGIIFVNSNTNTIAGLIQTSRFIVSPHGSSLFRAVYQDFR